MDGSRDYRTKWSKSDKEKQILYHLYVETKNSTNKLTYKTERLTDIENKHGYQKGNGGINQKYGINRYTLPYIK